MTDMTFPQTTAPIDRPGWPEIAVGLLVFAVVGFGGGSLIARMDFPPLVIGLIFTGLSGLAGLAGFAAAVRLRIRALAPFGFGPVSRRWLWIGLAAGVFAFFVKGLAVLGYLSLVGSTENPQDIYAMGATGGVGSIILATILLGILTPIGEEFLFRGVLANALLRYGALVGVVGSALIFAVMHGINMVFPAALVAGLVAGEVFRRSGSIWPAVIVHIVFNLPTIPVMVWITVSGSG